MRLLRAELSKLVSLPSVWTAFAVGLLVPSVIAYLNASSMRGRNAQAAGLDVGFEELGFGVIAAIILGVVAVSSEYATEGEESAGGRQITASLTAAPSRGGFLLAKIGAVALAAAVMSAVATAATLGAVAFALADAAPPMGEEVPRMLGVVVYWVLTALLASAITLLTRNGIVPLAVLILNTSVVSVTFLLSKVTPLASYLPDMAGARMITSRIHSSVEMPPVVGGLVMAAWVAALLAVGAAVFLRRDA
ncbi:ABC-2 family transporter protein [Sinosporangium album]|uniref:ABC-2 family transporter protein n=1 Tax=Sinosporangium album TaxID=504805 RepID=A0A1G7WS39_9ACTN|nr:ABC transporter permease [Sinosporangium album]SDG74777.1 ABC-2 family transporter protein [Sinosporangium album]